jgi:benzoate membrane transport protein
MRTSVIISALVAVLVGFGGSVAVVLSAAEAVGATQAQTTSWIAVLCLSMMATTAVLSISHKMPIVTAWSTPGAALIATTTGLSINVAVGAFLFCATLLLLTAAFKPLGNLVQRIPSGIAAAILAGVLFPFVLGVVTQSLDMPELGLPLVAIFLVVRLFSPAWAVLSVLGVGLALAYALGLAQPAGGFALSRPVWVAPEFQLGALIGLGLPLYLVTMASQNLPGFAVLRASGYVPPSRSIVAVTGLASLLTAPFGAHTTSLAAITASICTGEDAHPDKDKRWLCGPVYAAGYAVLALVGASLVGLISGVPPQLVTIIAGVALFGPFVTSAKLAFSADADAFPPALSFVVTASGVSAFGIGAAFWGLVAGVGAYGLNRFIAQRK